MPTSTNLLPIVKLQGSLNLPVNQIAYLSSDGAGACVHTTDSQKIPLGKTFGYVAMRLSLWGFVKVKHYWVNPFYIKARTSHSLHLLTGQTLLL
ncbi:MAG: hypothetical protein ACK4GN_15065 [Runella sp.]